MAGRKKTILDEVEAIESAVAAELTESNNLNKPTKKEKTDKEVKTAETSETEKDTKAKKTAKTEKATKTKTVSETDKATKAEKPTKAAKADKTAKSTKPAKTTKTDKAEETGKATKTAKTSKSDKVSKLDSIGEIENISETDRVEVIEVTDDIVEYIQPSSLEALKARYGAAEEDEQIRNEGFELAKKSGLVRRPRPEDTSFEYYSAPATKDDIRTDVDSSLSEVFDSTKSEFDASTVSFEDIATDGKPQLKITPPVSQEAIKATGNRYGYDTHTTVIYVDESADDGIRRNSEDELTSAFAADNKHKRRIFPWLRKRK